MKRGEFFVLLTAALLALPQGRGSAAVVPQGRGSRDAPAVSWREGLALAADLRWFCSFIANGEQNVEHTPRHREIVALTLLNDTLLNTLNAQSRRLAILGLARIGSNMTEVVTLHPKETLENDDVSVRLATADAIGLSFDDLPRDPIYGISVMPPWNPEQYAEPARFMLETHLKSETDAAVAAAMLRSLARLSMDVNRAANVEVTLGANLTGRVARVAGAVGGLEILARRAPKRPFGLEALRRLRDIAENSATQLVVEKVSGDRPGPTAAESLASLRRLALLTLHESNNDSEPTLIAALYDGDWQVRRLAAMYLPARDDRAAMELERLLVDKAFQVRVAALTSLAPRMRVTLSCARLMDMLDDTSPAVVMTAIDVAPLNCSEKEVLVQWLRQQAESLCGSLAWQVPARALAKLVALKDPVARSLNARFAATHSAWEVRQLAATLAETLNDEVTTLALASVSNERHPNVRAAALRTLTALNSTKRGPLALAGLRGESGKLVMAAAAALPATLPLDDVRTAMERALTIATWSAPGNPPGNRDLRVTLINNYSRFPIGESPTLRDLLRDRDPVVAKAAADALTALTGSIARAEPRLQAPSAPQAAFLRRSTPQFATLELSNGGIVKIELLTDDAPLTVAMFVYLARFEGFGSFFDVAPGVGVRAGASENAVDGRSTPIRDELGEVPHTRGAVAMMSNGHDLGNGQIFIDLIDRPDLDHGYTVFGRVVSGLDAVDRILQGTRIVRVTTAPAAAFSARAGRR